MRAVARGVAVMVTATAAHAQPIVDPWETTPPPQHEPPPWEPPPPPKQRAPAPPPPPTPPAPPAPAPQAPRPSPAAISLPPLAPPTPMPPIDADHIHPNQVPVEPPPPPRYSRSLVDRPLLLPHGMREGVVAFVVGHEDLDDVALTYGVARLVGKARIGAAQPYVGMDLLAFHTWHADMDVDVELPVFQRLYAGASVYVAKNTTVGVQAVVGNIGSERQRYSPSVHLVHKVRTSERGAIVAGLGADYNYGNEEDGFGYSYATQRVGVFGSVGFEFQPTSVLAFSLGAGAGAYHWIENRFGEESTTTSLSYNADLLISVTENADVVPSFSVNSVERITVWNGGLFLRLR